MRRHLSSRLLRIIVVAISFSAFSGHAADFEVRLIDAKTNQPLRDAVVSLIALSAADAPSASATASPKPVEIMQRDEEFIPFVTAVRTGTPVVFPNRDTVQHHVYSLSKPRKFELPLYDPGKAEIVVFDQPGIVAIGCNIHDWMLAYVVVLDTPHFAVTPESGNATLTDLPPGRYRAEIWHPRLAQTRVEEITLPAPAPLALSLKLKPDRRIRRPPTHAGGSYR